MLNEIKKNICIITDINGIYGYGHFTRMNLIADRLSDIYNFTFSSVNNDSELYKRTDIKTIEFNKIAEIKPYIIIVDSREVEEKYISYLKKISSVIIVDSVGSERRLADIVIEMLPNLDNSKEVNIKPFITTILNNAVKPIYNEDSPILVYLGFNKKLKDKAIQIISKITYKKFLIIDFKKESEFSNIEYIDFSKDIFAHSYSAVITYFGLTAFECIESKIPTILFSPTKYHDELANKCDDIFFNLGFFEDANIDESVEKIEGFINDKEKQNSLIANAEQINTDESIERLKTIFSNIKDFKDIKCPLCGRGNAERKNRNLESNLYKCCNCNTLFRKYFLSPFTDYSSKYFVEDYKKQYGKTYEEDVENLSRLAKRRIEKIKQIKPNGKVLDIGSAMGFFLKEASNYGYITEGIEISEYASNYCVNTLNLNVHNCSLVDFNYKEKEYDIITAWYVVEHIYNFDKIFENILYSLKDDGIFALAMPNGYGVSGRFNKDYYSIVPSDHAFEANPKSLDMFFAKYSLKRISLENQSIYYNRFTDVFKLFKNSKISEKIYKKLAQKFNLGDTFECIYQKVK